jgi:hypothetical protein
MPATEANSLSKWPISTNSNLFRTRETRLKRLSLLEVSFNRSNLHTQSRMPAISRLRSKCNMHRRLSLHDSGHLRHRRTLRNRCLSKRPSKCHSRIPTKRHRRRFLSLSKCRQHSNSLGSRSIKGSNTKLFNSHNSLLHSIRTSNNLCLSNSHKRRRTGYHRLRPRKGTRARIGWTRIVWAGVRKRGRSD